MVINVSAQYIQYNGGLLPDVILLTDVATLGNPFDNMKIVFVSTANDPT